MYDVVDIVKLYAPHTADHCSSVEVGRRDYKMSQN